MSEEKATMCHKPRRGARSAFTLVELLIVIAIIALLAALTTAAVMRFSGTGPRMATVTNLNKIKGAFDTQWNAVRSKAMNDVLPSNFLPFAQSVSSGWNPPIQNLADVRARQVYVELKLAQAFPRSFAEALDPTGGYSSPPIWAQPHSPYKAYLKSIGITSGTADAAQQGVCLLMALDKGPSNNQVNEEVLGSTAANRVTLNNGNQAWACVDAWGRPLLFARKTRKNPTNSDDTKNPLILQPVILSMGADAKSGVDSDLTLLTYKGPTPPPTGVTLYYTLLPDSQYGYDNLYTLKDWDQYLILSR